MAEEECLARVTSALWLHQATTIDVVIGKKVYGPGPEPGEQPNFYKTTAKLIGGSDHRVLAGFQTNTRAKTGADLFVLGGYSWDLFDRDPGLESPDWLTTAVKWTQ